MANSVNDLSKWIKGKLREKKKDGRRNLNDKYSYFFLVHSNSQLCFCNFFQKKKTIDF